MTDLKHFLVNLQQLPILDKLPSFYTQFPYWRAEDNTFRECEQTEFYYLATREYETINAVLRQAGMLVVLSDRHPCRSETHKSITCMRYQNVECGSGLKRDPAAEEKA